MVRMKDIVKGNIDTGNEANSPENDNLIFQDIQPKSVKTVKKPKKIDNTIIYSTACKVLKNIALEIKKSSTFNIEECFTTAKDIVLSLKVPMQLVEEKKSVIKSESLTYIAIKGSNNPDYDDLVIHAVNVAIYSVKIGMELKYNKESLLKLCLSALLHDIGMLKIPDSIFRKEGKLTEDEMKIVREHPKFSHDIIESLGEEYSWLAEVIYQEHERFDGSGYPQGLVADEINEFSRVIGITDVFEAMTHVRPYKKVLMPFFAVKNIIRSRNKAFGLKVIKGLLRGLSIFPVGTFVRLNSKEIGKVIYIDEMAPLRPILEVLYDSEGNQIATSKRIDLRKDSLIFISNVLSEHDDMKSMVNISAKLG